MNAAEIAERLGLTLLHTLWEGTAVALLLALALLALRRAAANVRYLAACAGLLATLAAAIATFCILSAGDAAIAPQLDLTSPPIPHRAAAIIPIASPPIALDHGNPVPPQVPLSEKIRPYLPALTLFWLAGVLLVSLYRIGGWIYLRRIVALAKPQTEWIGLLSRLCEKLHVARPVRLLYSARIDVPMVTGWLRPAILLPVAAMSGLSVDDVRAILAHELAHIRRHDYLVNLIQTAIETLLFYHPATWWIARQIRRERENCCDDVASAAIGSKLVYARALAELEEQRHLETMAMAANGSPLLPRIRRLLGVRQSTSRPGVGSMIALVAVVALLLSPLVIHQSHAANTTSPPAGNVSITIRCTDGAGKPVAGASVYFAQIVYTNDNSKVTRLGPIVSDANGQVRVHVPPFGRFSSIRQVVYARVPGQWVGSGDKYIEPDLPGAQGDPAAPINVNLSPSVTIRGKVYVPTGIDPSKVTITTTAVNYAGHDFAASFLWPDTPPSDHWLVNIFNAHPESDGSFQLPDAPVNGNTYLVADGPGVGEAQVIVSGQRPASSTLITATPDDVAINMQPEAVVAGIALAPDGKPLANATVVLQAIGNELSNNDPFTGTTGRDGRYRIAGLPALPMSVQLQDAPNCVMATQSVLLQAGETVTRNIRTIRGALVTGRVTDVSGKGVLGAVVGAENPPDSNAGPANVETGRDGRYAIRLPPGPSIVYVSAPANYLQPLNRNKGEDTRQIDVPAQLATFAGPSWVLQFAPPLKPTGIATIEGRVVDIYGGPVGGVPIADSRVEDWDGEPMPVQDPEIAVTNADGKFRFKAEALIEHQVLANSQDYTHPKSAKFTPAIGQTVDLPDLMVRATPVLATVSGIVTDPHGNPLEGVMSDYYDRNSPLTDVQGRFTLPVRSLSEPVEVNLYKPGFVNRDFFGIPPGSRNVHFVIYPDSNPLDHDIDKLPKNFAASLVGNPAPSLQADWIFKPRGIEPTTSNGGGTILAILSYDNGNQTVSRLKSICDQRNITLIVLFSPYVHPLAVHAMYPHGGPDGVAIGIDAYVPKYDGGATQIAYGAPYRPSIFVIAPDGDVTHFQQGTEDLASYLNF